MGLNLAEFMRKNFELFFNEDDLSKNLNYLNSLPSTTVHCHLKIKDNLILTGLPYFFEAFNYISNTPINYSEYLKFEGKQFKKDEGFQIDFELPFDVALSGERIALNLLQRMSSVATYTKSFVDLAGDIKILDTRKTTPGLRAFEKYAVTVGGGFNHRLSQLDCFMIKDNHKSIFGGVENAILYFKNLNSFYNPIIMEVHDLKEINEGYKLGVKHFLLDNFSPSEIQDAIKSKKSDMTFEVSGGITLQNIENYLIKGVDAISSGSIIYNAPSVDISLKMSSAQ